MVNILLLVFYEFVRSKFVFTGIQLQWGLFNPRLFIYKIGIRSLSVLSPELEDDAAYKQTKHF